MKLYCISFSLILFWFMISYVEVSTFSECFLLNFHKMWRGIVITFVSLSVCLSLSVNTTTDRILQFWWNLVRLCIIIIKDGLCLLIFKAIEVKQTLEIIKIRSLQEYFSTYWCQTCTVDVKLNNSKDIKALMPWYQKSPLKPVISQILSGLNESSVFDPGQEYFFFLKFKHLSRKSVKTHYFSNIVWQLTFLFSFWP